MIRWKGRSGEQSSLAGENNEREDYLIMLLLEIGPPVQSKLKMLSAVLPTIHSRLALSEKAG